MAQRSPKIGTLPWDDDVSTEPRVRRVQQVTSPTGRTLPGMPLDLDGEDEDDLPRKRRRYDKTPSGPWYRPATRLGRILLASGAVLAIGALTTGILMVRNFLEHDNRFRIAGTEDIQTAGMSEVTRAEILPVFGEDIGKNIFFIHLSDRRKQLEQIPWIEKATVMRLLPDQICVSIVERTPVAFVRQGQHIGLVDRNGVLLEMPPAGMTQHHYSFPVVTGINAHDSLASRRARMAVYQSLIRDLDSNGQHLSEQISEIDLTDPEDARVLMPEQGGDILAHFGDEQFLTRYQRYKAHIAEWKQQYPRLASVDLRYDNQVVLEMAPGSGAAQQVSATDGKPVAAETAPATRDGKPSPAEHALTGSAAAAAAHPAVKKPVHPQHKPQPHHVARAAQKSAAAREREKREAAARAALLRRQRQNATNANRLGQ